MKEIIYKESGKIGQIIFNRPSRLNAISTPLQQGIIDVCHELGKRRDLSVVIVSGSGKAFMAGADLELFAAFSEDPGKIDAFTDLGVEVVRGLYSLPQYTICAIEGCALGGGYEFALHTNYIIAGKDAKIGLPESQLGLIPGLGGAYLLEKRAGAQGLKLAVTGEILSGERAVASGLIDEVTDNNQAWKKAMELAEHIAKNTVQAIHLLKKQFLDENPLKAQTIADDFKKRFADPQVHKRIRIAKETLKKTA